MRSVRLFFLVSFSALAMDGKGSFTTAVVPVSVSELLRSNDEEEVDGFRIDDS
jgi:hypothetical protein